MKNYLKQNLTKKPNKKQRPKNLSGNDLIKPKKNKKNHSGIILSEVFTTLLTKKDSSWNTKNHAQNTPNQKKNKKQKNKKNHVPISKQKTTNVQHKTQNGPKNHLNSYNNVK